jgi:hypothetical protein
VEVLTEVGLGTAVGVAAEERPIFESEELIFRKELLSLGAEEELIWLVVVEEMEVKLVLME